MTDLDRLYGLLNVLTGISRVRDARLEQVAADRALEARYQVGTDGQLGITHPINQLKARVWSLHPSGAATVGENATWHYYPPSWVDPIEAAVDATLPDGTKVGWWNTVTNGVYVHRQQLLNPGFTSWGLGIDYADVPNGARRWYFINVFAGAVRPLVTRRFRVLAGSHIAYHYTADGKVLGSKTVPIAPKGSGASFDVRADIPGRGPHLHAVDGAFRTLWLPETARSYIEALA